MAGSKGGKRKRGGSEHRRQRKHQLLAAVRHPLRRRILVLMADGRNASPSELALALREPLSSVAYHVRVLAQCGALQRTATRKVRGATQHFYRRLQMPEWILAILEEDEEQSS